ncbi:limbic system-associated membrane protein-like [Limulus polyphemus]|uniref:Limbic system-associated membrane protein-like n=1 Tax=Limulus polyphemus TaxID=6850 RepID=A0ABM1SRC0_LIMPO|nr:limbic system-associated membrane protein-like [Limulus polyphemus]
MRKRTKMVLWVYHCFSNVCCGRDLLVLIYIFSLFVTISTTGTLNIQPFQFPTNPTERTNIQVMCGLERGDLPVNFQWLKNDIVITKGSVYDILSSSSVSVLTVKNVTVKSSGNYTCSARSPSGVDLFTAELLVRGK